MGLVIVASGGARLEGPTLRQFASAHNLSANDLIGAWIAAEHRGGASCYGHIRKRKFRIPAGRVRLAATDS